MPGAQRRGRGTVRGEDYAVLNDHVGGFDSRIEQHRMLLGIGQVRRVTAEDASVVGRRTVGIGNPVEFPVHEVEATTFVSRVRRARYDDFPIPLVLRSDRRCLVTIDTRAIRLGPRHPCRHRTHLQPGCIARRGHGDRRPCCLGRPTVSRRFRRLPSRRPGNEDSVRTHRRS